MSNPRQGQNCSGAVLLCSHVASGAFPALRGRRDKPLSPEDSGWQFRCNISTNEVTKEVKIWSIDELLEQDDSLRSVINEPYGTIIERKDTTSPWVISRFDPDIEE